MHELRLMILLFLSYFRQSLIFHRPIWDHQALRTFWSGL